MLNDILVILMVAFGLFAISMFVLFYVYLKKHYNEKHIDDDFQKEMNDSFNDKDEIYMTKDKVEIKNNFTDEEFIPRKKK